MLLSLRGFRPLAIMAAFILGVLALSVREGRTQWLFAQEDPAPAAQAAPPPPPQATTTGNAQRAKLDSIRLQLDQLEAGVSRRETDEQLQAVAPRARAARRRGARRGGGPHPEGRDDPVAPQGARPQARRQGGPGKR